MALNKSISDNCVGSVIYRNMPIGEVFRYFSIEDGYITLSGDPESKFSPTDGSMLTVYMRMEDVSDMILNHSYVSKYTIDPSVSQRRKNEAAERQLIRNGYSYIRSGTEFPMIVQ
jgi:hypothetical protein